MKRQEQLNFTQYRALSEFRYQIRCFLHFSESAARTAGLEPQQHQLLLAVKSYAEEDEGPTVGYLAERLQIKHNSAVELVDRMTERRLVRRKVSAKDRRQVIVELTATGERLLQKLTDEHLSELDQAGPELVGALDKVLALALKKR